MKFVLSYRTELFMIFLVPILEIRWYRFIRYSGTGLSAMMVPFHAIRRYRLTDTIIIILGTFRRLHFHTEFYLYYNLCSMFIKEVVKAMIKHSILHAQNMYSKE